MLVLGILGCYRPVQTEPPIDAVEIEMTGHDFQWHSRYAGQDGQLGTSDDVNAAQVLHVPVDAEVDIVLKSLDYIYSLAVPQAGLKEIAVPDLTCARPIAYPVTTFHARPLTQCGNQLLILA